jgi:hypothetical protein
MIKSFRSCIQSPLSRRERVGVRAFTTFKRLDRAAIAGICAMIFLLSSLAAPQNARAEVDKEKLKRTTEQGLEWLSRNQSRLGAWSAQNNQYPTAMTAMSGIALLCEGSTTTQGKYAPQIRKAVDYLLSRRRPNGLLGDPNRDDRYTYGHGFGMLFLSQVLGEEEDAERREELIKTLTEAVKFCGQAQTKSGGWGYVSAKDGSDFDEGSTTITQVQGLRGCRNAGIVVPREIIDNAIDYIHKCTTASGGVLYQLSSRGGGGGGGGERPAISAAAIACLYNAGEYDSAYVSRVLDFCKRNLDSLSSERFGHWHYAHYYYSQVMYRQGGKTWEEYRDRIYARLISEASSDGSWSQGSVGQVYTTAINLTILQLEKGTLPIYQR